MQKLHKNSKFKLVDYIIIALMASMGIGIKTIIVPLTQIITSALFIPGGVLAGGFYMAFLVLGSAITKKPFTATLIALVQAVIVTITGTLGSHGAVSLLTYTLPGIAVDLLFFLIRNHGNSTLSCFLGGMVANLVGSFAVNLAIFKLSLIPLLLSLTTAALSGGLGGLIAS
ncbi:MAG: ECF transporter S component, partial [Clostridia bacterium]